MRGYTQTHSTNCNLVPVHSNLTTVNPALAAQWHPTRNGDLTPRDVTAGQNKKVWWLGSCGHEWEATVNSRNSGRGCPYCSGHKVLPGYNDLATTHPDLAAQWHPTKNAELTPQQVSAGSDKRVIWICKVGHDWPATISSRTRTGCGCPYCAGKRAIRGVNDLATTDPDLAAQWHPTKNGALTPQDVTAFSNKRVWWLGACGHDWQAKISNRSNGRNCPICIGKKVQVGYNDLATTHPALAAEWHPTKNGNLTPRDVTAMSNRSAHWLGQCGHEWETKICNRSNRKGCPYCSSVKLLVGFNDLATTHPEIAAEWHPTKNGKYTPQDVMANSERFEVWWRCTKGHAWKTAIGTRTSGHNCPHCACSGTSRMQVALTYAFKTLFGKDVVLSRDKERMGFEIDILFKILTTDGVEIGVEVGSRYHHSNINKDLYKIRRCATQGVLLLGYIDGCRGEERPRELPENWGWYSCDTYREKEQKALRAFFDMVCGLFGIENASSLVDWDKINAKVNAYFQHLDKEAA